MSMSMRSRFSEFSQIFDQTQGIEVSTSHMPFSEPPHGPFINCLGQRVMGHRPPCNASCANGALNFADNWRRFVIWHASVNRRNTP